MALIVKKPKGTEDIVPSKVYKWHTVEKIVSEAAEIYGFKEIRVPTLRKQDFSCVLLAKQQTLFRKRCIQFPQQATQSSHSARR